MLAFAGSQRSWKKINYRSTSTVLAAEFLHGLYARHNPFLNPFRFANTMVVFRPWQTTSYAPVQEWDRLAIRFGGRFLRDHEGMCAELDRVLDNSRPRSRALAAEFDRMVPADLDDGELMDALIKLQHVPLGEIYEVNLVQVEHALHAAARSVVAAGLADPTQADRQLARLCRSAEPTVAASVDLEFIDLVLRYRAGRLADAELPDALAGLVRSHAEIGAAYGAETVSLDGMTHRFREYAALDDAELRRRQRSAEGPDPAAGSSPRLDRLLALLRRTGEVRDRNKRLLGTIVRHRAGLLREVADRRGVAFDDVRLYLLEELLTLIEDGMTVPGPTVRRRAETGLVFTRREVAEWPERTLVPLRYLAPDAAPTDRLVGTCASPGRHTGTARVVATAADLARTRVGDVVVAVGTDFDLILLLQMAGAIVTEEGGLLSHAAVIARELGTPCLIGVAEATSLIVDGDRVVVDADAGLVHLPTATATATAAAATAAAAAAAATGMALGGGAGPGTAIASAKPRAARAAQDGGGDGHGDDGGLLLLRDELAVESIGFKAAGLLRLRKLGYPTPWPAAVLPTRLCRDIAEALEQDDPRPAREAAEEITHAFAGRLSLRSSSMLEDLPDWTAAGIYHSEVGVAAEPATVVAALRRVLASRTGPRARAYAEHAGHHHDDALAILVTSYLDFTHQGTAVSHSTWETGHVAVEFFDAVSGEGCPEAGGSVVHFPYPVLDRGVPAADIPHLGHDLARVAEMTRRIARELDGPVLVEWGVHAHRVVLLQARRARDDQPPRAGRTPASGRVSA